MKRHLRELFADRLTKIADDLGSAPERARTRANELGVPTIAIDAFTDAFIAGAADVAVRLIRGEAAALRPKRRRAR